MVSSWHERPHPLPSPGLLSTHKDYPGDLSILTSASTEGLRQTISWLPETCKSIDLYTFMQSDIEWLFDCREMSAIEAMAMHHDNEEVLFSIAKKIFQETRELKIKSMSTYLPEISSHHDCQRQLGIEAMVFCIKLAHQIGLLQEKEVSCIELVGGTRTEGAWILNEINEGGGKTEYIGYNTCSLDDGEDLLSDSISDILEFSGLSSEEKKIRLALEIEPGPLNIINSVPTARRFFSRFFSQFKNPAEMRSRLGLNLDIGHVCSILGADSRELAGLLHYVDLFNVHLSDHAVGHICDLPVGWNWDPNTSDWLEAVDQIAKERGMPGGYVLELEASTKDNIHSGWGLMSRILANQKSV